MMILKMLYSYYRSCWKYLIAAIATMQAFPITAGWCYRE
jgi:hypothetical protein